MLPRCDVEVDAAQHLQLLVRLLQALHVDRRCGGHESCSGAVAGEAVDRRRQALALLVDPLLAGVGLGEGLGELDRVVTDDRAYRRSVGGRALPEVGEVAHHRDDGVARGEAPVVHEVPLERLRGGAVRLREGLDAGLVLPVLLLLLERSREVSIHFAAMIISLLRGAVRVVLRGSSRSSRTR